MKKSNLITVSAAVLLLSVQSAAAQVCTTPPTCDALGYTKSASECSGMTMLKCPLDQTKVYCPSADEISSSGTYKVGDTYYKDGTAVGIVAVVTDGGLHGIVVSQNTVPGTSVAEVQRSCSSKTTGGLEWGIATCENVVKVRNVIQSEIRYFFAASGCTYYNDCDNANNFYGQNCKEVGGYCQASF